MQRNIIRQFRFNKEENEVLKEKAKKCCITDSALVRMLVLGFIPKPKPEKEFYDALRYLSSMSNSLHQISAKANALNFIDVPKLDNDLGFLVNEAIDYNLFIVCHAIAVLIHVIAAIGINLPTYFCHSVFKMANE